MSYELQLIDKNCNDCKFMQRDFEKLHAHKKSYEGTGLMDRMEFGDCEKLKKQVAFISVTCMPQNKECFEHRKIINQ